MNEESLLIHYWQLPEELFITMKDGFHVKFCNLVKEKINSKLKNCFHKLLNCPKWHAQRLFTKYTRFTLKELEELRKFAEISEQEVEKEIASIGNHEDGAFIRNPKLPFQLKDLVYVASHLMFDGSYREKKGCYFYAYEDSLVEYHKKRLSAFGEVPTNFMKEENQLYFSYTLGYIASKILEIKTFRSTKCRLSEKMKGLAKENKMLVDEMVKSLIIDEGNIEDKMGAELSNEQLIKDLHEVISSYYNLTKITARTRDISFKGKEKWKYHSTVWNLGFSASSFKDLFLSISPLPIEYKQKALEFLNILQNNNQFHRKHTETKKLIISSLLKQQKTLSELAEELIIRRTTVSAHIRNLPFIETVGQQILRRGGYAKENIFGIKDIQQAQEFLDAEMHYKRNKLN